MFTNPISFFGSVHDCYQPLQVIVGLAAVGLSGGLDQVISIPPIYGEEVVGFRIVATQDKANKRFIECTILFLHLLNDILIHTFMCVCISRPINSCSVTTQRECARSDVTDADGR